MSRLFNLSKWYLDCVTDTGDFAFIHVARLHLGWLKIPYAAVGGRPTRGAPLDRSNMSFSGMPVIAAEDISCNCPKLRVNGVWKKAPGYTRRDLFAHQKDSIQWECVIPNGNAKIKSGGDVFEGRGYVERLSLNIPPWELPFKRLRWGRFTSPTDHVVWIDWSEGLARSWVFVNGEEFSRVTFSEQGLTVPDAGIHLRLLEQRDIRSGRVRTTAFRTHTVARLLSHPWKNVFERRTIARSQFESSDKTVEGWSVYEELKWD